MKNIIFIEGVSGAGKTTTTSCLCEKLLNLGYKVNCYLEGDANNPLDPFDGKYPPAMPLEEFSESYMQYWANFIKSQFCKDEMILLDGMLLHHQINDLIRGYDAPDGVIADYLSNLLNVIQQMNPVIIYLSSDDISRRLRQARKNRKQSVPTKEQIAFWENRKRVDLYILNMLLVESYILNIDGGWNSILDKITEHITV